MAHKIKMTLSSGNVFADLNLPNPEELLAKAELVRQISELIKERSLTQMQSAKLLGTTQPKVSDLLHGRLTGLSIERLIRFLKALDQDVEIVVKKKPRGRARARVRVLTH